MYCQSNYGSGKYQFNFHQDYSIRFYHGESFIPEEGPQILSGDLLVINNNAQIKNGDIIFIKLDSGEDMILHCIGAKGGGVLVRTTIEVGSAVPDFSQIKEMGMVCATASSSIQSDPS